VRGETDRKTKEEKGKRKRRKGFISVEGIKISGNKQNRDDENGVGDEALKAKKGARDAEKRTGKRRAT